MTANKVYYPAFIGGKIIGVQMTLQNTTGSSITCDPSNGIYYTFDGRDYQILSLDGVTIGAGITQVKADDKPLPLIPTSDIKIMVDTAGLDGVVVNVQITWEVA